jgi:dihydroxy-acid dehydratase
MARGLQRRLTSYGDSEFSLFLRKAFIKAMGFSEDALDRPIVGITDTYSDYNPCHGNVPQLIEAARRGVLLAGGLPMAFPTMSLHESFAAPTSMYLRNLMAMETEELVRAQPMDAVLLVGGCDKTIPAQVMAAASGEIPAIVLPTGPMDTGSHRGERLGACTDCRRLWGAHRAGTIDADEIAEIGDRLTASVGTCTVMGTASTMACLVEAMGLALPMAASAPATSAERVRLAEASGRAAVRLAEAGGPTVAELLTPGAVRNAVAVLQALGGSTNGVVHLAAIVGRLGRRLDLAEVDALGRKLPVLVDLKPSGSGYMRDFHEAGGVPRLLTEIADAIDAGPSSRRRPPRPISSATRGAPSSSTRPPTSPPASTTTRRRSRRTTSSSCATRARAGRRGCRRQATSRSRAASRARGCATWCASPTRG